MTREEVIKALVALPPDDAAAIAQSITKGVLLRAKADRELAPRIAQLLGLWGIVIMVADETGPMLESTSHEDSPAVCQDMVKRLHALVSDAIDDACPRREPERIH